MFADAGTNEGPVSKYPIDHGLRFRASNSAYLSRTFGTPTSQPISTISMWVKRGKLDAQSSLFTAYTDANNYIYVSYNTTTDDIAVNAKIASVLYSATTSAKFRDPIAHYHVVVTFDLNNATAGNRCKVYSNNVEQTFATNTLIQSLSYKMNTASVVHRIGHIASANYFDGLLSEINFIDGQALTPSSFGETNSDGVWVAKKYTGTYGTNGFYLDFKDGTSATTLGYDAAGSNDWTPSGISTTAGVTYDWMVDTPTNNYAVLNPLDKNGSATTSNANLKQDASVSAWRAVRSTVFMPTGSWYWEVTLTGTGSDKGMLGISNSSASLSAVPDSNAWGWSATSGQKHTASAGSTYAASAATTDVVSIAFDSTTGSLYFALNGQWADGAGAFNQLWSGAVAAYTSLSGSLTPTFWQYAGYTWDANFGQRPFQYTPPTGFKALCTANLPAVAIPNPRKHFDVKLHTGTGSGKSITGIQFQPDLYWGKSRNAIYMQDFVDSVRGVTKHLRSNAASAESDLLEAGGKITSFNSDGYTLANGTVNNSWNNETSITYVDWLWKANGAGVTNTDGTITSTVSANQTAGFSIVTYTGTGANATVGHGLGIAPKMVILKQRSGSATSWIIWHGTFTGLEFLSFDTGAKASAATVWNSTTPSSTVFSLGTNISVNAAQTYVAYCFAEIAGYSKFGSYTGNGSTDGPFVFCGFRPRYVLVKYASGGVAADWLLIDTARNTHNVMNTTLRANLANADESTNPRIDATANGFKVRASTGVEPNQTGATYIFAAFAEHPFGGSNVAPSPAR